ncbi:MAG: hypothetical protein V4440_01270 [Pseudomonadota bacterium]
MIKVYIASKLHNAERFKGFREKWKAEGIDLHARWFDQAIIEQTTEPSNEDFHIFWLVDEEDVKCSDAVIVYGEKDDNLRGALVEAGIAIACGILVILVGDCNFGTWQHHPLVVRAGSFEHAKVMILRRFRVKD